MLVSCLVYSLTLKLEVTCSSEKAADFQQTTWHYIPEDRTLHNLHCENLKCYIIKFNLGKITVRAHQKEDFLCVLISVSVGLISYPILNTVIWQLNCLNSGARSDGHC
jgi:hypothetical protein